jgi:hypothetical protein
MNDDERKAPAEEPVVPGHAGVRRRGGWLRETAPPDPASRPAGPPAPAPDPA